MKSTFPKSLLTLLLCFSINLSIAQSIEFSDVKSINSQGFQAITNGDEVEGYWAAFELDKDDDKTLIGVNIYDSNLKQTHNLILEIEMGKLEDLSFNGSHFCLSTRILESTDYGYDVVQRLLIYDLNGKATGEIKCAPVNINTYYYYKSNSSIIGNIGVGFVFLQMKYNQEKKAMETWYECVSNDGETVWEYGKSKKDDRPSTVSLIAEFDDKLLFGQHYMWGGKGLGNLKNAKYANRYTILEMKSGKVIKSYKEHSLDYSKFDAISLSVTYDVERQTLIEFYDAYKKAKSVFGMFKNKVSSNYKVFTLDGEIKESGEIDLEKEVMSKSSATKDKSKNLEKLTLAVVDVVILASGETYIFTEMFRKSANVGGGVGMVMGNGSSASKKVKLYDMAVISLDKDFQVSNVTIVDKAPSIVDIPAGQGTMKEDKLAIMMKLRGDFDYSFTSLNRDKSKFSSVYINYDRSGESGNKYILGYISGGAGEDIKTTTIDFPDKPTWFVAKQAKPGYVCVLSFYKKEKRAKITLNKVDI